MLRSHHVALLTIAAGATVFSACGGSGSSSAPGIPPRGGSVTGPATQAKLSITIPQKSASSAGRFPRTISSSTQSVAVVVNAAAPQVFTIAGNPACAPGPPVVCNFSVTAPLGLDTFTVTTYDGPGGSGNVLNTGSNIATIAANAPNTLSLTLSNLLVTTNADSGPGSLRQVAGNAMDGDVVGFAPGVTTIMLTSGTIVIPHNIVLAGPGANGPVTIDGGGTQRIFQVSGTNVTIAGLTLAHGYSAAEGGAISGSQNLTLIDDVFSGNNAVTNGGAVANVGSSGVLVIANCTFTGNAVSDGLASNSVSTGGAVATASNVTIADSTFSNNSSRGLGGALHTGGTFSISRSTFSHNTASEAGAWDMQGSGGTLVGSTFDSNQSTKQYRAFGDSGAIGEYARGAVTIDASTFTNNSAAQDSGVMELDSPNVSVTNSTFSGNHAGRDSGVSEVDYYATFANDTFANNSAALDGGVMEVDSATIFVNDTFTGNTAVQGGGALEIDDIALVIGGSFTGNSSTGSLAAYGGAGGAILTYSPAAFNNVSFTGNSATNYGGAIFAGDRTTLIGCTLSANIVTGIGPGSGGGAIFVTNNNNARPLLELTNSTLSGNTVLNGDGGGIYNAGIFPGTVLFTTLAGNTASGSGGNLLSQSHAVVSVSAHERRTAAAARRPMAASTAPPVVYPSPTPMPSPGPIVMTGSIVAYGSAPVGPDIYNVLPSSGGGLTGDYNVLVTLTGAPLSGGTQHNIFGADPRLGPLQNNGGTTLTRALLAGSPAIGAVAAGACTVSIDQRGHARPAGAACDSGAYQTP